MTFVCMSLSTRATYRAERNLKDWPWFSVSDYVRKLNAEEDYQTWQYPYYLLRMHFALLPCTPESFEVSATHRRREPLKSKKRHSQWRRNKNTVMSSSTLSSDGGGALGGK